jgi:hypothetical protein
MMEHTNLFLFENKTALDAAYPDGKVTTVPGVAYARAGENEGYTVLFNKKITNYTVTLQLQDKSGATVGTSVTAQTPNVLDGETIKYKVVAPEIENYKPRNKEEKIEISGDTSFTVIYLGLTDYTITVHHMFSGSPITADTQVVVEDVWDESPVKVTIEPVSVSGYKAEPVTITVSGSCEYNLEYEEIVYEAIDLGLPSGTKWANMNLGAESPEGYGDYYAWGEIVPNKASAYTDENYRFYPGNDKDEFTKYNLTDNKMTLELADDAANVVMGGDWHMPTSAQCAELLDNTTSSWTADYNGTGVAGMIFTSNNNGNSIFFPAAGVVIDRGSVGQGEGFLVWSSSRDGRSWYAWFMGGNSGGCYLYDGRGRDNGLSVRGVLGELNEEAE